MSQRDIAKQLGLSPALMTKMKGQGCPMGSADEVREWRRRNVTGYCRTTAPARPLPQSLDAPPQADSGERLDLAQERALLIRAQRREVEIRLKLAAKTYAPIEYLTATLATASAAFVEHCDHIPAILRRTHPDLPASAAEAVMKTLADARNAFMDGVEELQLPIRADFEADDEPPDED